MAWRRSSRLTELAFIIRDVATVGIVLLGGLPTISRKPPVTQYGEPTHLHTDRLTAIESSAHSYMRNTQERVTRATGPRQKLQFFVRITSILKLCQSLQLSALELFPLHRIRKGNTRQ